MMKLAHKPCDQPRPQPVHHEFTFPDYAGGSLLNLMQTLRSGLSLPDLGYTGLRPEVGLAAEQIRAAKCVVLLVIDGLGENILATHAASGSMRRHQVATLTSVYPSTTASAIPTLLTGLPPQAHGLTGWHMWFEELAETLAVLPLSPRQPGGPAQDGDALTRQLFTHRPLSADLAGRSFTVAPADIVESPFNRYHTDQAMRFSYAKLADFLPGIEAAVRAAQSIAPGRGAALVHAYYPGLDSLMHRVGTTRAQVTKRVQTIDTLFATLIERLAGTNTLILLTADHGFIDAPAEHLIELDQHPELAAMLTRPLCGERRIAYAYVRPECRTAFAETMARDFGHVIACHRSADFIAEGWFGPGPAHPGLASRCGDFVLQMRGNWTIKDWMEGETRTPQPGVHAGASREEMQIPLVVAAC